MFHTRAAGEEVEHITLTFKEDKVVKASLLSAPETIKTSGFGTKTLPLGFLFLTNIKKKSHTKQTTHLDDNSIVYGYCRSKDSAHPSSLDDL
jgi:hypothetical protein